MQLHRIDPDRNMARFYTMSVQPSLFGEWSLFREWVDRLCRSPRLGPLRLRARGRFLTDASTAPSPNAPGDAAMSAQPIKGRGHSIINERDRA